MEKGKCKIPSQIGLTEEALNIMEKMLQFNEEERVDIHKLAKHDFMKIKSVADFNKKKKIFGSSINLNSNSNEGGTVDNGTIPICIISQDNSNEFSKNNNKGDYEEDKENRVTIKRNKTQVTKPLTGNYLYRDEPATDENERSRKEEKDSNCSCCFIF